MEVNDTRAIPQRGGIGSGGNRITGWQGTVHDLTAADKAANFRKSLDKEQSAAHPQAAATGNAIVAATLGVIQVNAPADEHTIKPLADMKKPDRQGEWEDRITRVEAKVAKLGHAASEQQSPFKSVFLAAPNASAPTQDQQWQELTASGTDLRIFDDGRNCLTGTASGQILQPGTTKAFVLLEIRDGDANQYWKLEGAAVDLYNNDILAVAKTPFINIKGYGTESLFQFVTDTVDSTDGAAWRLVGGSKTYGGIYWDGSNWVHDWLRTHP